MSVVSEFENHDSSSIIRVMRVTDNQLYAAAGRKLTRAWALRPVRAHIIGKSQQYRGVLEVAAVVNPQRSALGGRPERHDHDVFGLVTHNISAKDPIAHQILGQWIITFPGLDLIIVRTGHAEGKEVGEALPASFMAVASAYAWMLPANGH